MRRRAGVGGRALLLVGATGESRADAPAPQGTAGANAAAGTQGSPKLSPDGLFSSIKQSLREGDQEIIRGHFEVGSPPNSHRYYCLMDPKSRGASPTAWWGSRFPAPTG